MELNTSSSYLAVRDTQRRYYLNGHWTVDWPGRHPIAGAIFEYKRPYNRPESLISSGPTNETLVIEVRSSCLFKPVFLFLNSIFFAGAILSVESQIFGLSCRSRCYCRAGTPVYDGNTLWRELMRKRNTITRGPSYAPSAQQPVPEASVNVKGNNKYLVLVWFESQIPKKRNGLAKISFTLPRSFFRYLLWTAF